MYHFSNNFQMLSQKTIPQNFTPINPFVGLAYQGLCGDLCGDLCANHWTHTYGPRFGHRSGCILYCENANAKHIDLQWILLRPNQCSSKNTTQQNKLGVSWALVGSGSKFYVKICPCDNWICFLGSSMPTHAKST